MLSVVFPYKTTVNQMHVTLSKPQITFLTEAQRIGLGLEFEIVKGKQRMKAWGNLVGGVKLNKETKKIQLVEPVIRDFKVREGKINGADPILSQVRQMVGKKLPIIVLFDASKFGMGSSLLMPNDIKVVSNGISLQF